jgi:hypothetical protein
MTSIRDTSDRLSAASAAAARRVSALINPVAGDDDGITASEVLAIFPKVMEALRALPEAPATRRTIEGIQSAISSERLRETVNTFAPRLPVRDRATLEKHLDLRDRDRLTEALIRNAANATAVAGSVGGFFVLTGRRTPAGFMVAIPLRVATETLVVAAIEVKLIAELHEVHEQSLGTTPTAAATAALKLWSSYRGLEIGDTVGLVATVAEIARRPMARRATVAVTGRALGRRGMRLGAGVLGAVENRRATMALGEEVCSTLNRKPVLRVLPDTAG